MKRIRQRAFWLLLLTLGILALTGCATPTLQPTPTATRTPKPTLTPTPTVTPTPSPTPTPAFPVTVACEGWVPEDACGQVQGQVASDSAHFVWQDEPTGATVVIGGADLPNSTPLGVWTYAVAAPFFTVDDAVTMDDLQAAWAGTPSGPFAAHGLVMSESTRGALSVLLGDPAEGAVEVVSASELLTTATTTDAWALVPFHRLTPQWKVLQVDGVSLLKKGLEPQTDYPLEIAIYGGSASRPEVLSMVVSTDDALSNRRESEMTVVVMTGVTAMTRATAQLMDRQGVTYPAKDVQPWFSDADFVHISNEVSFKPDCVAEGSGSMSFCSHDSYIALLEEINANVIELTGNHLEDKGAQWVDHSLEMYRERGWQWFGGGANQLEGSRPITMTHNGNKIAFIGCNTVGPFAGEDSGGAARCDFPSVQASIRQLRDDGYLPIATVQYLEAYEYAPSAPQMRDFRSLASAGAVMVQGSQAHQPQTMEFYDDSFIHYGLGNFFFDQMWSDGTRQQFVDRLIIYRGRLLSIDLRTAILEEYGRPRPMTVGDPDPAGDRAAFLQMIFDLRPR